MWRFRLAGAAALNHPSLALQLPLPNGHILVNDDHNDRVIGSARRRTGSSGSTATTASPAAPGYLDNPDGADSAPPDSLLIAHATTTGRP